MTRPRRPPPSRPLTTETPLAEPITKEELRKMTIRLHPATPCGYLGAEETHGLIAEVRRLQARVEELEADRPGTCWKCDEPASMGMPTKNHGYVRSCVEHRPEEELEANAG